MLRAYAARGVTIASPVGRALVVSAAPGASNEEACPAPVAVHPVDPERWETALTLVSIAEAPGPDGPYLTSRSDILPVLEALIAGSRQFRIAHFDLG